MKRQSLQERNIFISGCSSGIGYCTAIGLHRRGYRVIASARQENDVKRLKHEGLECIPLDLDDSDSIQNAVTELGNLTGKRLFGLFNNAGFGQPGGGGRSSQRRSTRSI